MELFLRLLQATIKLIYLIVEPLLSWLLPRKPDSSIPPIRKRVLTLALADVVNEMRQQKLKSVEVVGAYIERIKEVNPLINAVVEERFLEAIKEAERADDMILKAGLSRNELFQHHPLLGVPFTVKEACGLKGMSFVVGSVQRAGTRSAKSCEAVELLRSAGAIPLVVSANPEYCFSIETNTYTNGKCLNPYDFRRSSGGSSGGEGALNGSGASLFGIGSDIAGSIRIPALFNGVFGHKPTAGVTSVSGLFPNSSDPDYGKYLQVGPITRFARDLGVLLQIMSGANAQRLDLLTPVETKDITIFYSTGFSGFNGLLHQSVSFEIQFAIVKAAQYLQQKGAAVRRATIAGFGNSTEISLSAISRLENFSYLMNGSDPGGLLPTLVEYAKSLIGRSKYTKDGLIFELMRRANSFMPERNLALYKQEAELLKAEIIEMLGSHGVLFFPTFHVPAVHHHSSHLPLWGIDYSLIFNVLGLPATHIPMGVDINGLPIGFQVIAAPYRDRLCFHIAGELEIGFGGWVPPTAHQLQQ